MFVDSSVFVAILSDEDDAAHFLDVIQDTTAPVTSGLVVLESVMRLSSKLRVEPSFALAELEALFAEGRVGVMPIEEEHGRLAIQAFSKFGKGRGHPAQLNIADCLSYACAQSRNLPLLYKGNDFAQTDLA